MSYEAVDLYITDSSPLKSPIEGVLVKIYNADGSLFFTQGTSDADGHVGFLLATQTYQLRFYKFQVSFTNPQLFTVLPAPDTNVVDVTGILSTWPLPNDPRLCRAAGYFRRATGAPARNIDLQFVAKFNPILLEGSAVITERDIIRTDDNGFATIDLIRLGQYNVTMQGMEDTFRCIAVPDAPTVNLPDLLLPVVAAVSFSPAGPYSMTVGVDQLITPTVLASDGNVLVGTAAQDVTWDTADPTVCAVMDESPLLRLRPFKVGTTTLTAKRRDKTIVRYPDVAVTGQPVSITVS